MRLPFSVFLESIVWEVERREEGEKRDSRSVGIKSVLMSIAVVVVVVWMFAVLMLKLKLKQR